MNAVLDFLEPKTCRFCGASLLPPLLRRLAPDRLEALTLDALQSGSSDIPLPAPFNPICEGREESFSLRLRRQLCPDCLHSLPFALDENLGPRFSAPLAPAKYFRKSLPSCLERPGQSAEMFADAGFFVLRERQTLISPVFLYEEPLRSVILDLKFNGERSKARILGLLAARHLQRLPWKAAALVPLPLGRKRLRTRMYNQAELIASEIARELRLPLITNLLLRARDTCPQTEMPGRKARAENVRGAFALQPQRAASLPPGLPLLLIDDVVTTGASFDAAAAPLRQAGFSPRALAIALEEPKTKPWGQRAGLGQARQFSLPEELKRRY